MNDDHVGAMFGVGFVIYTAIIFILAVGLGKSLQRDDIKTECRNFGTARISNIELTCNQP